MTLHGGKVVIAVIGVAGSGKSTFINLASGSKLPFSDAHSSCSTKLKFSEFSLDGKTVMLIDTPGFDDTALSVLEVLKSISDHFAGLYSQGIKLAGVIYMHGVAEDRMRSASRRNFQVFSKFCGDASLRDVLIVPNKWAVDGPNDVKTRTEESLHRDEVFEQAIDNGAQVICHNGSQASAHAILRHFLDPTPTSPDQGDSRDQKTDHCCSATSETAVSVTSRIEHYTKAFEQLFQGIDAATLLEDRTTRKMLQEEAELEECLQHDPGKIVTECAVENSRPSASAKNHQYHKDFTTQTAEAELRIRSLGEKRRARELAEGSRERAEAQLTEERTLRERQRLEMERENLREQAGLKYDKLFACGALIFVLLCVSRYAFNGSASVL